MLFCSSFLDFFLLFFYHYYLFRESIKIIAVQPLKLSAGDIMEFVHDSENTGEKM